MYNHKNEKSVQDSEETCVGAIRLGTTRFFLTESQKCNEYVCRIISIWHKEYSLRSHHLYLAKLRAMAHPPYLARLVWLVRLVLALRGQ